MTPKQETNVLNWVEWMLSGRYKHGRGVLFNPTTGAHDCLGVAAELGGFDHDEFGVYDFSALQDNTVQYVSRKILPVAWFNYYFGLSRPQGFYFALNDVGQDYLGVCAQLLHACPGKSGMRWVRLNNKMQEQANVRR